MFFIKAGLFSWIVWLATKMLTTAGSLYYPRVINEWYDFNHRIVSAVPYYGDSARALMRDNVADGTLAFWEVWIVLGMILALLGRLAAKRAA